MNTEELNRGEIYVSEESVSHIPPDPNEQEPDVKPEEGKKSEEEKPEKEKPEKEPEVSEKEPKEPEGEPEKKPEEVKPERKKAELPKGVQKRINKLTARNYGLKKQLKEAEKQIAELSNIKGEKELIEEIAEHSKTKPVKAEFESYEDYVEAKSKWDIREALLDERKKEKAKEPEKKEDPDEEHEEIFKAGREAYEDFEEIVRNPKLELSETMFLAALESDSTHEILYHLGKNPEESARIFALSPVQQAREIGKLEMALAKEEPPTQEEKEPEKVVDLSEQRKPEEPKKTTEAPPPIESVHGKSVTKKDPGKMSNEEYREHRGRDRRGWKKG